MMPLPFRGDAVPVTGFRYLVSTARQSFDAYEVYEQASMNYLLVTSAARIGTVIQVYGNIVQGPVPWLGDASAMVRRLMPEAKELHVFRSHGGHVDCYYRDSVMPARFFLLYRLDDIADPLHWYRSRPPGPAELVFEPAWD